MQKRKIFTALLTTLFTISIPGIVYAASGEYIEADTTSAEVFVEPIDSPEVIYDWNTTEQNRSILEDYVSQTYESPLTIDLNESGSIRSICTKGEIYNEYELYILQDGEILFSYHGMAADSTVETKDVFEDIKLFENEKYYISIVINKEDSIDSYDGYFSIHNTAIVYDYLFYNCADKKALDNKVAVIATQYEAEPNDIYSKASILGEGNTMYGNISNTSDRDWYRVQFSRDGIATFSLTNIPSGTNYNMTIYGASNAYTTPVVLYQGTNSGSINENFKVQVDSDKVYYMEIFTVSNFNASRNYCVKAENSPITDQYEINDTTAMATSIVIGNTISATIHDTNDVDFYKLTCSNGTLTIDLTNIPSGKNYDLELYNSSNIKIASSNKSGTTSESISYFTYAGTYYLKVFSANGADYQNKYMLSTSFRPNLVNLTCTVNPKVPSDANATTGTTTYIKDLPIKIYTVTSTGLTSLVSSGTTNASGSYSKNGISIGSTVTMLRAVVTFDNTQLSIQDNNGTVYTFSYDIPIGSNANISVSLPNITTMPQNQLLAYAAWKNGLECISLHNSISSTSLGKLILRSSTSDTTNNGSLCSGTSYIHLCGASSTRDYLDKDVILHEMGHWLMNKLNVMPSGAGGSHSYSGYYTNALAYSEGWATFYSCAARNNSQMMDYFTSSNSNYGVDLSNAKYYSSMNWRALPLHTTTYSQNQTNEVNAGAIFWAYRGKKGYSTVQSILSPRKSSMSDIYDVAISNASVNEKEEIWNLFESRGCAFDMELPTVNLSISGTTAYANATDNISVKKLEWYVNGNLVKTTNNATSDSLSLLMYSGTVTIEVRAYDPEGIAALPRPRTQRFASTTKTAYCSISNDVLINSYFDFSSNIVSDEVKLLLNTQTTLSLEDRSRYTFHVDELENMHIYSHIVGGIEQINFYSPDGELYDTVSYISPDTPYIIENAIQGDWTIEFIALSQESMLKVLEAGEVSIINSTESEDGQLTSEDRTIIIDNFQEAFLTHVDCIIVSKPTKVACPDTIYTNNPLILLELLSPEKYTFAYENGTRLDYLQPLSDGEYNLEIVRTIGDYNSDCTYTRIIVDTMAPDVSFDNAFETYEEGIYLHGVCSEDTIEVWLNGEYMYLSNVPDFGNYLELTPGENTMTIVLFDKCGNMTTKEITLIRYIN